MSLSPAEIILYFYIPFLIADISIFIRLLFKWFYVRETKDSKILPVQQKLHLICFAAIILSSLFDMAHAFGSFITKTLLLPIVDWILAFEITADTFYYISSLTLYIILINRLHVTFDKSMYQISKRFLAFIWCFITFQALVMIAYVIELYFNCEPPIWCRIQGFQAAVIVISDWTLNAILFVIFIQKLRELVAMRIRYDSTINFDKNSQEGNAQNIRLLDTVTKQCIIGTVLTFANQMFAATNFISFMLPPSDWETSMVFIYLVRAIESVFVCALLYLGLQMNHKEYIKICGLCHNAVYDCCVTTTKKDVCNEMNEYHRMSDSTIELSNV